MYPLVWCTERDHTSVIYFPIMNNLDLSMRKHQTTQTEAILQNNWPIIFQVTK